MSPDPLLPLLLSFLALLFLLLPPSALSSPLSTFAVSRVLNQTFVCAIASPYGGRDYTLNCTTLPPITGSLPPNREYRTYPLSSSSSYYYAGVAAGNDFLCGLVTRNGTGRADMLWWEFDGPEKFKRLYSGQALDQLLAGETHVCGLAAGKISCWRWPSLSIPKELNFSDMAVGKGFVCGLVSDSGVVQCYGDNSSGVVGAEPRGSYGVVAAGTEHACAVSTTSDGAVVCWGQQGFASQTVPTGLNGTVRSLALGTDRTCALRSNDTVVCWGRGSFALPASLGMEKFLAVEAKRDVFCGLRSSDYKLLCWGNDAVADPNSPVFDRVLPGSCASKTTCECSFLDGTGAQCPDGLVICKPCPNKSPPPPPSSLPPLPLAPPVLQQPPPPSDTHPNAGDHDRRHRRRTTVHIIVGSVGSGVGLLSIMAFVLLKWCKGKWRCVRVHDSGPLGGDGYPPSLRPTEMPKLQRKPPSIDRISKFLNIGHSSTMEEFPLVVLAAATMSFSEEMKIGSGSFGSVYRAVLDDGREVAIKRAELAPSPSGARVAGCHRCHDKANAFLSELALLSRVNHKNLVRLLGFCREENELVLVYEFVANGTLHDHLHGHRGRLNSPLGSWTARIEAALDGARGVEYLHQYAVPPIIHRDIKSSNILLDDQWTAKVADFGLCLVGPDDETDHLSLRAAGTVGYMDPEYYRLQTLTTKSDVYSFGVVLLELLTGLRAIHRDEVGAPRNVVDYAVPHIEREDLEAVLDPRVAPPKPSEIEAVQLLGYLAEDCVERDRADRPDMSEVVYQLEVALALCEAEPPPTPPQQPQLPPRPVVVRSMTAHSV